MLKNAHKIIEYFYYAFFVLCTGVVIFEMPDAVYWSPVIAFVMFIFFKLYKKEEININILVLFFLVYSVSYIYFSYNPQSGFYYQSFVHFHAILFMLIGCNIFTNKNMQNKIKLFEIFLAAICLLYIIYALLTLYYGKGADDLALTERYYHSLWYKEVIKAATGLCMSFALPVAYGMYCLFSHGIIKKILGILLLIVSALVNLYTGTRTLVFIIPLLFIFVFFIKFVINKKKYILSAVIFCVSVCILIILAYLYFSNYDKIVAFVSNTPFRRYVITDNSLNSRLYFIQNILDNFSFSYFGGGYNTANAGMPHNMWLYIYDYGGIVTFILFTFFSVAAFTEYVMFMCRKNIEFNFKLLMSSVLFIIFVEYMTDAFILPVPSFYIISMFIFGVLSSALHATKSEKIKTNKS